MELVFKVHKPTKRSKQNHQEYIEPLYDRYRQLFLLMLAGAAKAAGVQLQSSGGSHKPRGQVCLNNKFGTCNATNCPFVHEPEAPEEYLAALLKKGIKLPDCSLSPKQEGDDNQPLNQ